MAEKDLEKIGAVIRIIDNRTLIINVGSASLSIDDEIKVYQSLDTLFNTDGTELCVYEYTKAILKVIDVSSCYSVCKYQKTTKIASSVLALSPLLSSSQTTYVPLNVNEDEIKPLPEPDPVIHVGDPVKKA
mgnify:CR=1 FL=1